VERLLSLAPLRQALGSATVRELKARLAQRRGQLETLGDEKALAELPRPAIPEPSSRATVILDLARALDQYGTPPCVTLVVDGYNVTKTMPALVELEQRLGLGAARDRLVSLCRLQLNRFLKCELVFDGEEAVATRENQQGVTVVFAAHVGEENNADQYIVDRLTDATDELSFVWLVTNDTDLRRRTEQLCAGHIAPADLYRFLSAAE